MRGGPGILLRDIERGKDPQVAAVIDTLVEMRPDILLLTGIDWDADGLAFAALADRLADRGHAMPGLFHRPPNAGWMTDPDIDLDGDGRVAGLRDAQSYGRFHGHGGMVLLSRLPIASEAASDFSDLIWHAQPWADPPRLGDGPFPSERAGRVQRLSSVGHWAVPVKTVAGAITLLAASASPPVFDGPEDRNGRRNRDEAALWLAYLAGHLTDPPSEGPVIVIGKLNADPQDGEARRGALLALLTHPRLQDPEPASETGIRRAADQAGANLSHRGDPALDTADWNDDPAGPGNLRASYILPDRTLQVVASGLHWPASGGENPLRHALVWVDLALPEG